MASSQDPMKLATQVHKLETQLADVTKEKDGLAKELSRLRDLNKRGDAELQKAIGVLNKSKEAQHLSLVMDERDTYQQQVAALRELLRSNAEELEKYRKLLEQAGPSSSKGKDGAGSGSGSAEAEAQEKLQKLRARIKEVEKEVSEAEAVVVSAMVALEAATAAEANEAAAKEADKAAADGPATAGEGNEDSSTSTAAAAPSADGDASSASSSAASAAVASSKAALTAAEAALSEKRAQLTELKTALAAAEEEAEAGASDLIKATRARDRLEREAREKVTTLERTLEAKIKENAALNETLGNMEGAHSRDIENLLSRLTERELEVAKLRSESKASGDMLEALKTQLEETRRKADDETKKAVDKAIEKEKEKFEKERAATDAKRLKEKEKLEKDAVDGALALEMKTKMEAAQMAVRQLTEATAELQRAKEAAESEARSARDKLIKREQKLAAAIQEKAEALSSLQESSEQATTYKKRLDKQKKDNKALEESLKLTRLEVERCSSDLKRTTEAKAALESSYSAVKASLDKLTAEHEEATASLAATKAELAGRTEATTQLELALEAAHGRMQEMRAEHSIAVRLTRQLNKELKAQLAAESKKAAKLERDMVAAAANAAAMASSTHQPQHRHRPSQHAATFQAQGPPGRASFVAAPSSNNGSSGNSLPLASSGSQGTVLDTASVVASASSLLVSAFTTAPAPAMPPVPPPQQQPMQLQKPGSLPPPSSASTAEPMEETVRLLGQRLTSVLADAEVAKEKVRMLEGIVQDLANELDEKKRLIKQLTAPTLHTASAGAGEASTGGSALPSASSSMNPFGAPSSAGSVEGDEDSAVEASARQAVQLALNAAGLGGSAEAGRLLTGLLSKSMVQEARLRRDMRTLAGEVQKLTAMQASSNAATTPASPPPPPPPRDRDEAKPAIAGGSDIDNESIPATASSPGNPFAAPADSAAAKPPRRESAASGNPFGAPSSSTNPFGPS